MPQQQPSFAGRTSSEFGQNSLATSCDKALPFSEFADNTHAGSARPPTAASVRSCWSAPTGDSGVAMSSHTAQPWLPPWPKLTNMAHGDGRAGGCVADLLLLPTLGGSRWLAVVCGPLSTLASDRFFFCSWVREKPASRRPLQRSIAMPETNASTEAGCWGASGRWRSLLSQAHPLCVALQWPMRT